MCNNCNNSNCGCEQEVHICNQCPPETCDCPILGLSTDCSTFTGDDIECDSIVVVAKNTILSDALANIVSWSCTKFSGIEKFFRIINTGTGAEIYSGTNLLGEKKLRKLKSADGSVAITQGTDDIDFSVTSSDGSETKIVNGTNTTVVGTGTTPTPYQINAINSTYSNSNLGMGAQVYKDSTVVGSNTQFNFRKLKSSDSSVTILEGINEIDITVVTGSIPDGSETKVTAGTNTSVTGTGTIATPYVINSTDTNTTYSAGTAMSLVGTTFNNTAPDQTVVLTQGGATTITGTYPNFTITSTDSNTTYSAGTGLALIGTVFSVDNLQKVITYPGDFTGTNYTLTNADNNYEIIINNGATAVSITVPSGLTSKIGVGFTQKGTGDVSYTASGTTINNPIGLKIKGQYYQTFLSQESNTNLFYLGGNTKI